MFKETKIICDKVKTIYCTCKDLEGLGTLQTVHPKTCNKISEYNKESILRDSLLIVLYYRDRDASNYYA